MKTILIKIKTFFYYIFNFRKILEFKGYEKKLEEAIIDKQANQVILMREIKKEIDKLWPKGRSKYIPLSFPQRIEILAKVYSKFGDRMKVLKVAMNSNLHFV